MRWKSWFATIPPQFGRLTIVAREVCFSFSPIGRIAVRAPKWSGAELYRRESFFGKEKVMFLVGVADLGRRAPRAVVTKSDKKRQKVTKSAIRLVVGRDFTAAQWILVKKR